MSLVEKALQKIQAQQVKPPGPAHARVQRTEAPPTTPVAATRSQYQHDVEAPFVPQGTPVNIDTAALRKAGLLPAVDQERAMTRQLRAVKHSLLRKMAADELLAESVPRTVMVTSGLPGDGKTFTSVNLAISLAMEKDINVVLVDADIPKPHITGMLGLTGQPGLIDVLMDPNADIASVVRSTSVRGLHFVPAGRDSDVATELLSSSRMTSVVQRLATLQSNFLVVFDSPPMLVTSEARALAALMSQILVVVKSGTTPQAIVKQTVEVLGPGAGHVSLLLNDARNSDLNADPYGYGYGYAQNVERNTRADAGAEQK